jgi:enterochelin esterase-like enzyme
MKTAFTSPSLPSIHIWFPLVWLIATFVPSALWAQPGAGSGPAVGPSVVSPQILPDGKVVFRILAAKAEAVQLGGSGDIPGTGFGQSTPLTKGSNGVWEVTVGPLAPGAYRYNFNVDGVAVLDPRNPATSESNENAWSLVVVPGADWMDTRNVPHGAVAEVTYWSSTLQRFRRLHVYTPPGYESGAERFPILYLLHGAFDSDDSWTSVGRAGFILDNLIADGKARPMIVVMPHGHTGPFRFGTRFSDEFEREFLADILPQMEQRYRVRAGRENRALAGLSMGGAQTLNLGIPNLEKFAHLGVFSSGIFGIAGGGPGGNAAGPSFEERHQAILDDTNLKAGLKLFWFATGKNDFLVETTRATVAMFKKHEFNVIYEETEGAHTWDKWREYLAEFAPKLFQ